MASDGVEPYLLASGSGESVWLLGGRFTTKVTEAVSGGRFALVEALGFETTEPTLHGQQALSGSLYLGRPPTTIHHLATSWFPAPMYLAR